MLNTENSDTTQANSVAVTVEKPMSEGLLTKAVIISFKTGRFGNTRRVGKSQIEISVNGDRIDQDALKTNKELLDSKELQAIGSFDAKTRVRLLTYCLPSYIDEGYYFLPITLVEDVNFYLSRKQRERERMVEMFCGVYRQLQTAAKDRLGPLYRESDYPAVEEVRRSFTWVVRYISFSVPGSLRDVSSSLFEQEKERQEKMWEEAAEEVRQALRESMAGLVQHAIEKLNYQTNGKPQIFRDSMVANMAEFLDLFDRRNLTNDASLAALVGQARQLMAGVDPATLRSDVVARDRIRAGFQGIQATMDSMLVDKPVRAIDLDD